MLSDILQIIFSSLSLGAIYALVALGIVLIFKATDLINFGQGDWVLAGGYVALILLQANVPLWAIFVLAPLLGAGLGVLIDLAVFRRLAGSSAWMFVLGSLAVGGLLREVAHFRFESNIFPFPSTFPTGTFELSGAFITAQSLWVIFSTGVLLLVLWLFFSRTRTGKAMQGLAENRVGASIVGVNVRMMLSIAFGLSMLVSTFAALLLAPQVGVSPAMGSLVIKGFVAAALGGLTSLSGAIVGGATVALAETVTTVYITSTYKNVIVFSLLLAAMWLKPTGILGRKVTKRV